MLIAKQILDHLPSFISEDPYLKALLTAKAEEYFSIEDFLRDIEAQLSVNTATWGLKLWEQSLGLASPEKYGYKVKIEQDDPIIKYKGTWHTEDIKGYHPDLEPDEQHDKTDLVVKYCNASDKSSWFEFAFQGTGFKIIRSSVHRERSKAEVYCDNELDYFDNTVLTSPVYDHVIYEQKDLYWGKHTVRINPIALFTEGDVSEQVNRFVFDRIEIYNDLADGYEKRRKLIKAKLVPIITVTNKTIEELVRAYGFTNVRIDESEPNIYKLEFDYNASSDLELRKRMINDVNALIPAHIEFDNMFLVSTFKDLLNHNLSFNELNAEYIYHDFLVKNIIDKLDKYVYLNKYYDLSIFNFASFNSDLNTIDTVYTTNITENLHDANTVHHSDIVRATNEDLPQRLSELNLGLLTDKTRKSLYKMFCNKYVDDTTTLTQIISDYDVSYNKLLDAVTNHPLLKRSGSPVSSEVDDLLRHTAGFNLSMIGIGGGTIANPKDVVKGKVALGMGGTLIPGTLETFDPAFYVENHDIIGYEPILDKAVLEDSIIPAQPDLRPENIKKGYSILGVKGTMISYRQDKYNQGDYLFPWGLDEAGDSFVINSTAYINR